MTHTNVPAGTRTTPSPTPNRWWEGAGGLAAPIAAAIALWVLVVAGVAAPLGAALARLDAACAAPPAEVAARSAPLPPGALASTAPGAPAPRGGPRDAVRC